MQDDIGLVGLSEVADLLRISRQAVGNWRQRRHDFPDPVVELKSGPIWRRDAVVDWAAANGIAVADRSDEDAAADDEDRLGTTVALMNMKGGVGKSTVAANLGYYGAYYRNERVLLVDLDPQFNLSQYVLGTSRYQDHVESKKKTVLDIFEQGAPPSVSAASANGPVSPGDVIASVRSWEDGSRLDIMPSSLELSFTLKNPTGKEQLLKHFLDEIRTAYDLILIDCPPTESILTSAAYYASDSVLIPVRPEFLSTIGLPLVVKSLDDFEQIHKDPVDVLGIVFNGSTQKLEDDRSRAFVRKTAKENGWYVFSNAVSYSDSYPKGSRYGKPIFLTDYARGSKINDFKAVAGEFYDRLAA